MPVLLAGCGKSKKRLIVGSMNGTEQGLIGEIVAQHLEKRLNRPVERRFGVGSQPITYQALASGEISLYPEYTGEIESAILKEPPDPNPSVVFERARSEMLRTAQMVVLDPLGYDNPPVVVIRASDAEQAKLSTLSQAAERSTPWKLGVTYEFRSGANMPFFSSYNMPLSGVPKSVESEALLFPMLQKGDFSMIVASASAGPIQNPDFRVLADDKHVFRPNQACLMIRADVLNDQPDVRAILGQLSGKFTLETIRKMDAEIDLDHRSPAQVGAEFLAHAGL